METNRLKSFAQQTRKELMGQVARRLDAVLAPDSAERREAPAAVKTLEKRIAEFGKKQVVEQVAYTWFNRFTALRYMDVNGYLTPMVVSPAPDQTRPELLAQAAAGAIPDYVRASVASRVRDLLEGRAPAREPQVEAYRLLVVATCNHLYGLMPYMFEEIADYTELLMPNDLLAADGWVAQMRAVMTEEACKDVEVIGWLYQFYISEKKDEVFAGLKKNQKITPENIPAATQLFTPHWIVRYLVENSLGRLWMLNRPGSKLVERMDYYIAPEEPETDFLRIGKPEEIKVCDPACGSAHMLTYAFDLLHAIYEEEGYDPVEIPALILEHNLTGIEIDDRAGALAAFALAMKAAARLGRRRFLRMEVKPNVVVLQNVSFTPAEMAQVAEIVGRELFTGELRETLMQFAQAKNFGSLVVPQLRNPAETMRVVEAQDFGGDLLLNEVKDRVVSTLRMAEALSPKHHVVVANPPYMGRRGLNEDLRTYVETAFPIGKTDLYAAFMVRGRSLTIPRCYFAMINMQSWMFLGSFEALRDEFFQNGTLLSMAHIGERGFDSIGGAVVSTTAFIYRVSGNPHQKGTFIRLVDGRNEAEKEVGLRKGELHAQRYTASASEFRLIPGQPVAYWVSHAVKDAFATGESFRSIGNPRVGMQTSNNERYLRLWFEIDSRALSSNIHEPEWIKYVKGGPFRRWYGNLEYLLHYNRSPEHILSQKNATLLPLENLVRPKGTWTDLTSGKFSARHAPKDSFHDISGHCFYPEEGDLAWLLAFSNTNVFESLVSIINSSFHFQVGDVGKVPVLPVERDGVEANCDRLVEISKSDWDDYETSWDFSTLPLLSPDHRAGTVDATYARLRVHWQGMTDEMQRLEEENNRIFIDAYGLQDELTPEVPIEEITLTCNPAYRYGVKISEEEREARLLADTMREFVSYAIGCMFGRYSLDAPGLILANQGETLQDYMAKVPTPTFVPDRDNVIPLLEEDRFEDDAYQRFREFLALTFGEEKLVENLEFMRAALGKEVRAYLAKDFYADHVQRYKKRPIYWLVSSPKGAFQALIYMHRYTPDTLSVVLNDYVRTLRDKLEASRRAFAAVQINPDASAAEKNRAGREIDKLAKQIAEITEWERDALYPLAVQRIEIDLDDGVKRNYPKFAGVLKPIKGLDEDA